MTIAKNVQISNTNVLSIKVSQTVSILNHMDFGPHGYWRPIDSSNIKVLLGSRIPNKKPQNSRHKVTAIKSSQGSATSVHHVGP